MGKVIITGVTGQDGSYMVDYLLKNTNHKIYGGVRRLSVPNHKNISHINDPRFQLINLDISDPINVSGVINEIKPDYFINFAANSFVGTSWNMPVNHFTTNTLSVLYQLEAIREYCPKCRYYNAGSSEEFGDVEYWPQPESHPIKPRSPYGASKASARHIVKVYRESFGLYAVQGWLFNHECLEANTPLLLSENGRIKVEYVRNLMPERSNVKNENNFLTKEFDDLRIWDGNNFVKIKAISRKKISSLDKENQKIVYTNTRNGVVATTPNHSLYVDGNKTKVDDIPIKTRIDHLNLPSFLTSKIHYTSQQCRIYGYLAGDGYVGEHEIQFVNQNESILTDFINCITETHPSARCRIEDSPSGFGGQGSKRVVVSGISDFCKIYRKEIYDPKTKHKKVPDGILNSHRESRKIFFKAYYACDGLKNGDPDFWNAKWTSFKTNSPILAHGLLIILNELTQQDYNINVFEQNEKIYYHVNILSNSSKGAHLLKPKEEIKKFIEKDAADCFVYDIETEVGYFSGGVGKIKIGNSERRGEEFVTRKITKHIARIKHELLMEAYIPEPLYLGNLNAQRDWSHAEDFVFGVWQMLNQESPKDYVLSSQETHSVRDFVNVAMEYAGINGEWSGEGVDSKFISDGMVLVAIDPKFYRPAEVDLLLGDSSKAREELNWEPLVDFKGLVERMMKNDLG